MKIVTLCLFAIFGALLTSELPCTCALTAPSVSKPELSWEALDELLDVIRDEGPVSGPLVPVYRMDLADDYVAYWSIEVNSTQYVVISSGPKTGDYKLATQGPLPSLISEMDMRAGSYGKVCSRYYMLSTDGEMMCLDSEGKIVATTVEEDLVKGDDDKDDYDPNYERAHAYLSSHMSEMREEWVERMYEVRGKRIWGDEEEMDTDHLEDVPHFEEGYNADDGFYENCVEPGDTIRLPVDEGTKSVRALYVRDEKESPAFALIMQEILCKLLSLCDRETGANIDISKPDELLGYKYVELVISDDVGEELKLKSVDFELQIEVENKELTRKRFSLQYPPRRQKRWLKKQSHSSQPQWDVTSVDDEQCFPDYHQHWVVGKTSCAVGSGPVAWAMVFGYYDKRSHYNSSVYGNGSQSLYSCGDDGTDGNSSCEAPQYSTTNRIMKYTRKLGKVLGTKCWNGIGYTWATKMGRVNGFFQARQTSGSPRVSRTNTRWRLFRRSKFASQTRAWIAEGWPVVVGTNEDGIFKRHYSVATKYRVRRHKFRFCLTFIFWKKCWDWRTENVAQMYIHLGLGPGSARWRGMSIHYSAVARY